MRRIKQEKGFLLLSTFLVIIVFAILTAVIFSQAINENLFVKKHIERLKARYNAEFGYQCLVTELLNNGSSWATHTVGLGNLLYRIGTGPNVTLSNYCAIDVNTGEYKSLNGEFIAKLYKDPQDSTQSIMLSRGINGNYSYLLAAKISSNSLYDYFNFSPENMSLGWTTYLANGGKMHTNKNIILGNEANIQQIRELSAAGYLNYYAEAFIPTGNSAFDIHGNSTYLPGSNTWDGENTGVFYYLRWPWIKPTGSTESNHLGYTGYYHNQDGLVAGDLAGLYMVNPNRNRDIDLSSSNPMYVSCGSAAGSTFANCILSDETNYLDGIPTWPNPALYNLKDYYIYGYGTIQSGYTYYEMVDAITKIQPYSTGGDQKTIQIPNRLGNAYWWDEYWKTRNGVTINNTPYYYPAPDPNPDNPIKDEAHGYKWFSFLNTQEQSAMWQNWLSSGAPAILNGVIKEHNTGGEYISPLHITPETYVNSAKSYGIYIGQGVCDGHSEVVMQINGANPICPDLNGKFIVDGKTIAKKYWFMNTNSAVVNNVLRLDIDEMNKPGTITTPGNGIIYADYNLLLENAKKVCSGSSSLCNTGLTTVSSQNIYLKGDYNITNWIPSSAISAQYIYTLSDNFDFPQTLDYTIHNPNYPNVSDSACGADCNSPGWYANKQGQMPPIATTTTYNVSMIGNYGSSPQVLERWCGSDTSEWSPCITKTITGAFVNLPAGNFASFSGSILDSAKARCKNADNSCSYNGGCRDCASFPGWSYDMTSYAPDSANKIFQYETRYYTGGKLPPGEMYGYYATAMLEIPYTDSNFSHHYAPLN